MHCNYIYKYKNLILIISALTLFACTKQSKDNSEKVEVTSQASAENASDWINGLDHGVQGNIVYELSNKEGVVLSVKCMNSLFPGSIDLKKDGNIIDSQKVNYYLDGVNFKEAHINEDCRVCGEIFENFWNTLRTAKDIKATSGNSSFQFSASGKAAFPKLNAEDSCQSAWATVDYSAPPTPRPTQTTQSSEEKRIQPNNSLERAANPGVSSVSDFDEWRNSGGLSVSSKWLGYRVTDVYTHYTSNILDILKLEITVNGDKIGSFNNLKRDLGRWCDAEWVTLSSQKGTYISKGSKYTCDYMPSDYSSLIAIVKK